MSFQDIADMAEDWGLRMRLIACAAQEHHEHPSHFVEEHIWRITGPAGWSTAWTKAKAKHVDEPDYEIGKDAAVITDVMITNSMRTVVAGVVKREAEQERKTQELAGAQAKAESDRHLENVARQFQLEQRYPALPEQLPVRNPPDPPADPAPERKTRPTSKRRTVVEEASE